MAPLPQALTVPCPPFTNVGLDLMGPFVVKKMGGGKTTRGVTGTFKCWGLLALCLNVKAIKIYTVCGYSTAEFLLAYEQFTADHGHPATIHSDRGSQLVSAAKEVEWPEYDWDLIEKSSGSHTVWTFCPSGAQFRNGAVEAYVKKAKRSITHAYGDKNFNMQELNTCFKRVSNILNLRPISAICGPKGGVDPDYLSPLTPNMLLLGRANNDIPMKDYEETEVPLARLEYIAEVEALWWNQYKVQDFTSLVPTYKWQHAKRNIKVGDVVLILYTSKSKSGEYRLGRVITTETDSDGLVRTCTVKYSLVQHMSTKDRLAYTGIKVKYIRVAVQRLVMILPVEEQINFPDLTEEEKKAAKDLGENEVESHRMSRAVTSNMIKEMMSSRAVLERVPVAWRLDNGCDLELVREMKQV